MPYNQTKDIYNDGVKPTATVPTSNKILQRQPNTVTARYKFSNISWLKGDLQQCVLRAAVDWKNFQSADNSQALYMAVMAMLGEEPENIHLLDGES